jgi:hypothetical protein
MWQCWQRTAALRRAWGSLQAPGLKLGAAIGHAPVMCPTEHHDGDRALRLAVLDLQIRHRRQQCGQRRNGGSSSRPQYMP